jgi:outer membrane protein OmpA-like peptidoglycan-associated protein
MHPVTCLRWLVTSVALLALTGCVSERVVLLPSPDGKPSAVVIRNAAGETLIDRPYGESVQRSGYHRAQPALETEVKQRYAAALAALPPRGRSFMLHFDTASDIPLPDSLALLQQVRQEIAIRPAAEIVIIGHTDRVGSDADNEALSLRRVESVHALLLAEGIEDAVIETAYRGEREPLVATPDGMSDPINRRVEISVR